MSSLPKKKPKSPVTGSWCSGAKRQHYSESALVPLTNLSQNCETGEDKERPQCVPGRQHSKKTSSSPFFFTEELLAFIQGKRECWSFLEVLIPMNA